jgi:hypothetical protein
MSSSSSFGGLSSSSGSIVSTKVSLACKLYKEKTYIGRGRLFPALDQCFRDSLAGGQDFVGAKRELVRDIVVVLQSRSPRCVSQ